MSDPTSHAARVRAVWAAAWDHGDVDALDALLAPDYRRVTSAGEVHTRAEFKESITGTRNAFPDLLTVIDEILVDGDRAAIRWHSSGTQEARFLGVPATGGSVTVVGATFARFGDGSDDRIVEEHVTWDPRSLLTALGILSIGQGD
ncbi:MAG: ester cyclase [Gordonia sp. (in: high G+C Gram-positive bacteria)]